MTDIPGRLAAALADRYRIERELGQGGMATVYLAEDLKHKRRVALKVLKPELAAVLGADRFVQEIATTAALQHPHILPLFDSGEADSFLYYVMPFIDGETLRAKLDRETQLGVDEAVTIAAEVADALEYAHQHGVIHRDIKPENILLANGRPMVADFGIALAVSAAAGGRMTETGLSLGTPHYMSPEQATAEKEISARSDVYSLGSVLFEMLAGEPPHMGNSAQQIIMKIIADTPRPVTELRKSVPPNVAAAVAKALEKLPADRFESARRFQDALTNPAYASPAAAAATAAATAIAVGEQRRRGLMAAAGWGVAAVATVALAWSGFAGSRAVSEPSTRFALSLGNEASASDVITISPDGRQLLQGGRAGLSIRDLGSLVPRVLPGFRYWSFGGKVSPDGRWLAYFEPPFLRKVPIEGGASSEVGRCGAGLDWLDANTIVCQGPNNGLARVPSAGGPVEELTTPDTGSGEIGHWSPTSLPGGRAVLFTSYRRPVSRVEAIDLESRRRVVIAENGVYPIYARSGHVLFVRGNALFAIRFDPVTLRTEGAPVLMLDDIAARPSDASAAITISDNGTLAVLRQSEYAVDTRVVWVARDGRESPAIPSAGAFRTPRLSPDQNRILVTVGRDGAVRNLWMYDLRRELLTQVTRSSASAFSGIWTSDGREVVFTNETPSYDLYRMAIDGSGVPIAIVSNTNDKFPVSVSPDGHDVAYYTEGPIGRRIRVAPLAGPGPGRLVGDTTIRLSGGVYSPDGRWLAAIGEGSTPEGSSIRVHRSDGTPGVLQVTAGDSADGWLRWTRGGRELVFRRGTAVFAVDVNLSAGQVGKPHKLFDGAYPAQLGFDAAPDGNRFLLVKTVDRTGTLPVLVITNFFDELRKKVGK